MQNMIAPDSLAGVHVFFPDPWPKKRHHKRRILQPEFVTLIASRLKPGGYLHCATDWQEYAEYVNRAERNSLTAKYQHGRKRLCAASCLSAPDKI